MKQFKVKYDSQIYKVFADSEVEAVNKVKEAHAKIGDETLLNTVNSISRWAGGNSQINGILRSGKKVTASQIVSLYEKNKGIKISNPNQRSQITSLVGRLSGFARDSVEVGDAYDIKPGAIFKTKRGDYYKVVRINNDRKVEWNFIGKPYNQKSGNQFEVFGYQENSIERFKEILSHSSARPVNSLYDSKSLQEVK